MVYVPVARQFSCTVYLWKEKNRQTLINRDILTVQEVIRRYEKIYAVFRWKESLSFQYARCKTFLIWITSYIQFLYLKCGKYIRCPWLLCKSTHVYRLSPFYSLVHSANHQVPLIQNPAKIWSLTFIAVSTSKLIKYQSSIFFKSSHAAGRISTLYFICSFSQSSSCFWNTHGWLSFDTLLLCFQNSLS